jgi:hypothetical protein
MERLMPNKTDALLTIETGELLERWARVVVAEAEQWGRPRGAISEWMVGPISSHSELNIAPLSYIYNSGRNYIQRPVPSVIEIILWVHKVTTKELGDMIKDLFGPVGIHYLFKNDF